jgi:hypothetical protein
VPSFYFTILEFDLTIFEELNSEVIVDSCGCAVGPYMVPLDVETIRTYWAIEDFSRCLRVPVGPPHRDKVVWCLRRSPDRAKFLRDITASTTCLGAILVSQRHKPVAVNSYRLKCVVVKWELPRQGDYLRQNVVSVGNVSRPIRGDIDALIYLSADTERRLGRGNHKERDEE